jgi:hypothetical protein
MTNYLNVSGILFDIAGAIFVVWGVLWNSVERLASQVATTWDYNSDQIRPLAEQWTDTTFGLVLLVSGFTLQLVGSFVMAGPSLIAWCGPALAATISVFLFVRSRLIELISKRVLTLLQGKTGDR